jgi:hypothetical protein
MLIILFVPITLAAWQRAGYWSVLVPVALAVATDAAFFAGFPALGWLNYLFVWIAVHQLGYAWRDGRVGAPALRATCGVVGLGLLAALTILGPYPVAMISEPDAAISNTLPPKLPLLALAMAQAGFILAAEAPLRRWLGRPAPWTLTVLLNGMIMTIYLWHSTAMIAVIGIAMLLGNPGLDLAPATGLWWLMRPVWFLVYLAMLAAYLPLVARFERLPNPRTHARTARQITGVAIACAGLALLAYLGLGGATPVTLQTVAVLAPCAGALLAGLVVQPGSAA